MKYFTIEEKKELILAGKQVPLCVSEDRKEEKNGLYKDLRNYQRLCFCHIKSGTLFAF